MNKQKAEENAKKLCHFYVGLVRSICKDLKMSEQKQEKLISSLYSKMGDKTFVEALDAFNSQQDKEIKGWTIETLLKQSQLGGIYHTSCISGYLMLCVNDNEIPFELYHTLKNELLYRARLIGV